MICREEMLKEQSIDTVERCRHSFHSECLKEWVRRKPECVRCIRPIPVRQGIYI
jgi:hypothetical protein